MQTVNTKRPRQRIFFQILLTTILLVIVSNILTLSTTYLALDYELQAKDDQLLNNDTRTLSFYLQRVVNSLAVDLQQIANFPALASYIDWEKTNNSSTRQNPWRQHVEDLFAGLISAKPRYVQVRLINQEGQEQVRVDQYGAGGSLQRVAVNALQDKGERDYFQDAIALDKGQTYFSPVELNREHGQIYEPRQLVVRAAVPLFTEDGDKKYGILIVNMALDSALRLLPILANDNRTLMVSNARGEYLFHPEAHKAITSATGDEHNFLSDYSGQALLREEQPLTHTDEYTLSTQFVPYHANSNLYLAIRSDNVDAVAVRRSVIRQTILILTLLLVLAIAVSFIVSQRLTRPIRTMSERVAAGDTGDNSLRNALPSYSPSEFIHLASALDAASDLANTQQQRLEKEIEAKTQARDELEEKIAMLDNKNQELQQFTYIASHDLQEPLRTVRSFVDVINKKYASHFDERGQQMMGFIDDASARMQELVRDLLDYGRIGRDLAPKTVNLMQLMRNVEDDLSGTITSRGAVVTYKDLPNVIGLETELRLLFQNLLSNAFKFTEAEVLPKVQITAHSISGGWRFAVCDNGIGIPEEYREKVFGVFKRLHNRQDYPGTGIGLAHCHKVVKLHGGDIWIEGSATGGTCVVFTLKEVVNEKNKLNSTC